MMDLRAVHRYSRALYELAEKKDLLDLIDDELLAARQLTEKHPEVSHLLSSPTIGLSEKEDFIGKVFPSEMNPLLIHFLKLLVKKKRFKELSSVQEVFHRLYEKTKRVEEVTVISAVALSEENTGKLKKILGKKLNYDIRLTAKTDSQMIGGLVLQFSGHEINASFRSRLDALHQILTA